MYVGKSHENCESSQKIGPVVSIDRKSGETVARYFEKYRFAEIYRHLHISRANLIDSIFCFIIRTSN